MYEGRLILASASPRRRELLASLGLRFEVVAPDVDEAQAPGEDPDQMVMRLARSKAKVVAEGQNGAQDDGRPLVIAADTTVVVEGRNLGKPQDREEAADFLRLLSGRAHMVHTGHALRQAGREATVLRSTVVRFRELEEAEVLAYAAAGEGLDKAGGYAIQGVGATMIEGIDGCYGAVVGLSLPAVLLAARQMGVRLV